MTRSIGARRRVLSFFVALAALAVVPAGAHAAPGITVTPTMPSSVEVGQTGVPASVTVTAVGDPVPYKLDNGGSIGICTNNPVPADSGCDVIGTPWDSGVTFTPSCAQTSAPTTTAPACTTFETGVFKLSPTAVGAAGTTCAGVGFNIVLLDATRGMYRLEPVPLGSFVTLGEPGTSCRANFTFDVVKLPAADSDPVAPGVQTGSLTSAGGWYWADDKKKVGPLKAVGSTPVTFTEQSEPPCESENPPDECKPPCERLVPPDECKPPCERLVPPPECLKPNDLANLTINGSCKNAVYRVRVRYIGDLDNFVRLRIRRKGTAKTLLRPNLGASRFLYKGSVKQFGKGPFTIKATAKVRRPGTFDKTRETFIASKAVKLRLRATRACFVPPPPPRPKVVRATIAADGGCLGEDYNVTVKTSGAARLVRRVEFKVTGAPTRVVGRPNQGGRGYHISGATELLPEGASVTARVLLRKPGSFKRKAVVLTKTLRQDLPIDPTCGPPPPPGRR